MCACMLALTGPAQNSGTVQGISMVGNCIASMNNSKAALHGVCVWECVYVCVTRPEWYDFIKCRLSFSLKSPLTVCSSKSIFCRSLSYFFSLFFKVNCMATVSCDSISFLYLAPPSCILMSFIRPSLTTICVLQLSTAKRHGPGISPYPPVHLASLFITHGISLSVNSLLSLSADSANSRLTRNHNLLQHHFQM